MQVLWRRGVASAEEVREELQGNPHGSTVRTLLRILEGKGHVRHEAAGKMYVYKAAVPRAKAQKTALRNIVARLFEGSAEDLVVRLIEDEQLRPEQLEQIRKSMSQEPSGRRGKGKP
jgi:predicted transcriptional regulator